jgi:7-carboxy-7-deazaguanine synthase
MLVTEIFRSIQGEGSRTGRPCIFVRLTGCNLRCVWCDTAYAFYGGAQMSAADVLRRVEELARPAGAGERSISLVEITGGEPLLQPDAIPLSEQLLAAGFTVLVETSGERFIGRLPREVIKIVDVKCPDSGQADTFDMANLAALSAADEVKFVIASRRDYEFARDFARRHSLHTLVREVIFSPVMADPEGKWPEMDRRALAEWMLSDGVQARLGLQLHKFIWDPATKGV